MVNTSVRTFFWPWRPLIISAGVAANLCRRLMGIRFNCPNGHKLNVKEFLAGKRGVCPQCGAKFIIPTQAEVPQPVGVGQSQSVEIAISPAPGHQVAGPAASPSVIIPAADIELAPPELELPTVIREPQIPAADALPASIV